MSCELTVFTPLYNREEYIDRLYDCLCEQSDKNFKWLVIDDGSKHDSTERFLALADKADFSIAYKYKPNGGKHTAINMASQLIETRFTLILDSDDVLTNDAVETVNKYIAKYSCDDTIGILSFQRGYSDREPVRFEKDEEVSDHISYRINRNLPGDCCEVIRTAVLQEYPFPVFEGEHFMEESHLWIGSADKYKTVYVRKVIYLCKYLEDGLTKAGRQMRRNCPLGGMHCQNVGLNPRCSFKFRAKKAMLLIYYGKVRGMKMSEIRKQSPCPGFVGLFTVPGLLLYLYWERKYGPRGGEE